MPALLGRISGQAAGSEFIEGSGASGGITNETLFTTNYGNRRSASPSKILETPHSAAAWLRTLRVSRREVLRATFASTPLRRFGAALRRSPGTQAPNSFRHSFMVSHIDEFWSHSWHGQAWQKVVLLNILQNGFPAMLAGHLGAALGFACGAFQFLPGFLVKCFRGSNETEFCSWALLFGTTASALTFILWHSRRKVFFDQICIHQTDDDLKSEGILNIGGMLRQSRSMLVLLDASYVGRLWCIFELAAFLKSRQGVQPQLFVRPVILGPISAVIFLVALCGYAIVPVLPATYSWSSLGVISVISLVLTTATIHAFRGYHRCTSALDKSLVSFSVAEAACSCCTLGHRDGERRLICDRNLVLSCVRDWFGSSRSFDACVQTTLRTKLQSQLGHHGLPYWWVVGMLSPCLWGELDFVASDARSGHWQLVFARIMGTFAWYLGVYPLLYVIVFKIAWLIQTGASRQWLDVLISFGGSALYLIPCGAIWSLWQFFFLQFDSSEEGSAIFLAFALAGALWFWGPWSCVSARQ